MYDLLNWLRYYLLGFLGKKMYRGEGVIRGLRMGPSLIDAYTHIGINIVVYCL